MTHETSSIEQEQSRELLGDNDRKFITAPMSDAFLREHRAEVYAMKTDWLEIRPGYEKKLAYKQFPDGRTKILEIEKFTKEDGDRGSAKQPIEESDYQARVKDSIKTSQKTRAEFAYAQGGREFMMKYDEFDDSDLCILEVDAADEATRDLFDPALFVSELEEVTGDIRYYGYRVVDMV